MLNSNPKKGYDEMSNYVIHTDSACDMPYETLKEWGVAYADLTFKFDDSETVYDGSSMPITEFYQKMRDGKVAKTAAANTEAFTAIFEKTLSEGNDVLHLGFSSGLSATFNCARLAANALAEKYPERKIILVDSLMASAGTGLYLRLLLDKKAEGASIEEVASYAEEIKMNVCAWFTVDDLVYLKRGGRISAATALVGNMLGIKPILHVDNEGHLINVAKARGRRGSIMALADKYGELARELATDKVYISHGDCEADAKALADILKEKYGATVSVITYVGSVIGAHSGPGTLALFFIGKER